MSCGYLRLPEFVKIGIYSKRKGEKNKKPNEDFFRLFLLPVLLDGMGCELFHGNISHPLTACAAIMRLVAMTFCYRKVKTRNKSLRSRADGIIRIKSTEIELEDPGIVMFRFRLGTITCNKEIHTICYQ